METVAALLMFRSSVVEERQFSRWARRGKSVFVMRLDDTRQSWRIGRALAHACSVCLVFYLIELGWSWGSTPLFPNSV